MRSRAQGFPPHHTLHGFARTIGCPALQEKACWNSGRFATMPLIRYFPSECGSVMALARRFSGRSFSQAHWANPTKKR